MGVAALTVEVTAPTLELKTAAALELVGLTESTDVVATEDV